MLSSTLMSIYLARERDREKTANNRKRKLGPSVLVDVDDSSSDEPASSSKRWRATGESDDCDSMVGSPVVGSPMHCVLWDVCKLVGVKIGAHESLWKGEESKALVAYAAIAGLTDANWASMRNARGDQSYFEQGVRVLVQIRKEFCCIEYSVLIVCCTTPLIRPNNAATQHQHTKYTHTRERRGRDGSSGCS